MRGVLVQKLTLLYGWQSGELCLRAEMHSVLPDRRQTGNRPRGLVHAHQVSRQAVEVSEEILPRPAGAPRAIACGVWGPEGG